MSSGWTSRPSSAASRSSRHSHASSNSRAEDSSLKLECKAAYLSVFDDIHDNIMNKKDFILVLQQTGRNPTPKVVQRYWDENTESISFAEFVDICRKEPPTSVDDLLRAFRKFDINGDGYISLEELYKVMTMKGEKLSRQEVKAMIDEVDENKDGRLDYKEFCKMFVATTEECKKMSLRVMEKKERQRTQKEDQPSVRPRKDKDEGADLGSQLSIRSSTSEKRDRKLSQASVRSDNKDNTNVEEGKRVEMEDNSDERGDKEASEMMEENTSLRGSRVSLQSRHSVKSEKRLSQASLKSASHTGSRQSLLSIDDLPKPSPRNRKEKQRVSRTGNFPQPSNLRSWKHAQSKGCFFVDEARGFVSHQYLLTLMEDTAIWLTIQPITIGDHGGDVLDRPPVDTAMYILRADHDDDKALVTFTEHQDSKGCYGVRCDLAAGSYHLIPFTTGCRLRPRKSDSSKEAKLVIRDKEGKITLTKPFRKALEEIFDMADLDGNGLLSRDEFSWFNIRTSDENVADDEWQVVEENVEMEKGEITKDGFLSLNVMEAEDNDGDTEDLWITLNSMGYNKALQLDEACPFKVDVYAEDGEAALEVTKLENPGLLLEGTVCASVIAKGDATKIKSVKDLMLYTYQGDARATVVIENKSRTKVTMELDCSKSKNCASNHDSLVCSIAVPPQSRMVGMHLLPVNESAEWFVQCTEAILK
ncbi:EF-hand calcium-binding domain-containing protein 7-like isoform X3 [Pomacea canaliculata]|uniref:EF-hand calcium-binding domain-containing protein 7-like isoform X3 n=1 Tax=Pomacea canaliculata TaxID=400727 RepID=UPI000D7330B9|nr:EF-hand calcium-binding domain-containing protein 7-like isoform X3 [Pomacea canaliculata]